MSYLENFLPYTIGGTKRFINMAHVVVMGPTAGGGTFFLLPPLAIAEHDDFMGGGMLRLEAEEPLDHFLQRSPRTERGQTRGTGPGSR